MWVRYPRLAYSNMWIFMTLVDPCSTEIYPPPPQTHRERERERERQRETVREVMTKRETERRSIYLGDNKHKTSTNAAIVLL